MELSEIKAVKIVEKDVNQNGLVLFNDTIKKMVSNYVCSWISNSNLTLDAFYKTNSPLGVSNIDSVYRGYGTEAKTKKLVVNVYSASTPKELNDITGINDIDGAHIHGIAILNDKTVTGWTMTGNVTAMGSATYVSSGSTLWNQSRVAATGGKYLNGVKKIGADFQASFALLEGDILTGWGNVGETWINPGYSSITRPMAIDKSQNAMALIGTGTNSSWGQYRITDTYTTGICAGISLSENSRSKFSVIKNGYFAGDQTSAFLGEKTGNGNVKDWSSVAVSYNRGNVYATVNGGNIWKSEGWWIGPLTEMTVGGSSQNWKKVSTDYLGKNVTAVVSGGNIWVSNDYGANWASKGSVGNWSSISMASGGKIQAATTYGGSIWISNDSGNTWNSRGPSNNWMDIAVAQEGKYQIAVASNSNIYRSVDSGNTWTPITAPGNRFWRAAALSENGDIQVAVSDNTNNLGSIWISTDTGYNWKDLTAYATGASNGVKGWNVVELQKRIGNFEWQHIFVMYFGSDQVANNKIISNTTWFPSIKEPSIQNPYGSYPYIYLTGVKDFDVGENYINLLLKTGSNETYMLSGWGNVPSRVRKDGLQNVKKIVSTRDHTFALLKSGDTNIISGWGLSENNLDQFETWLWASNPGGVSGWFSGFLNDYKDWTGIKDFDVGYNHGIAVFDNGEVSGWCSQMPLEARGLIGQINNRYAKIQAGVGTGSIKTNQTNFYLDTTSFIGDEQFYYTDIADWELRFNSLLNQWELVEDSISRNPLYRSRGYGSGALLGTWDGIGDYVGQQIEVTNNTVQGIYPIELGEAYISATSDKDWIKIDNQNLIFPWNRTIAYVGNSPSQISIFNPPETVNYDFVTPESDVGRENYLDSTIYITNSYPRNQQIFDPQKFATNWKTGQNDNKTYTSIAFLNGDSNRIGVVTDSGRFIVSSDGGENWSDIITPIPQKWKQIASSDYRAYLLNYSGFIYEAYDGNSYVSDSPYALRDGNSLDWTPQIFSGVNFIKCFNDLTYSIPNYAPTQPLFIGSNSGKLKVTLNNGDLFDYAHNLFGTQESSKVNYFYGDECWVDMDAAVNFNNVILLRKNKPPIISWDNMQNFEEILTSGAWTSVALSRENDGKYGLITSSGKGVYKTSDYGGTWFLIPNLSSTSRNYTSCSISNDGKYQFVTTDNFVMYSSYDYGLTWSMVYREGLGSRKWTKAQVSPDGHKIIACASTGWIPTSNGANPTGAYSSGCVVYSKIEPEYIGGVTLYPTIDYPLTVYREVSGAYSSDVLNVNYYNRGEMFLYQTNSKSGNWNLSLKYYEYPYYDWSATNIKEEVLAVHPKSINEIGYSLPPTGKWNDFYTKDENGNFTVLNSGMEMRFDVNEVAKSIDTRTGYMKDINFYIDYSKMLPNYSNKSQVYRRSDNSVDYSKFGANISVRDASSSYWLFNQNGVIEANPDFAVNVAKFTGDTGINWNGFLQSNKCGSGFYSAPLYGPLNSDMPVRSLYTPVKDYQGNFMFSEDPTRGDKAWYIFLKFYTTGFKNFSSSKWGSFKWKQPYMIDKSSNTKIPLTSEVYCVDCPTRWIYDPTKGWVTGPLWSGIAHNQEIPIYSGLCYHFQVRLYHPYLNSGGASYLERNIWPQLSTTGTYSGGYIWNGIEDQGSGMGFASDKSSLILERGREYRFIQQKPIDSQNKLKIYPSSGVEVHEYDSDNPSDYNFIQVKINSEDTKDQYIYWSKGDQSYIQNYTGSYINCRGGHIIGDFYETDISGIIPDSNHPNFVKYSYNTVSGNWYVNTYDDNKILGTVRYLDQWYPAEFWYLSGYSSYNTWPNNLPNGFKIQTAYAFLKSGNSNQMVPFYGNLVQKAKNINLGVINPSGNSANQRYVWNGKFKIAGKNNYTYAVTLPIEYPNPGDQNPFDINICTDYNQANNSQSWDFLSYPISQRSGISYFQGVESTGYFFKNRDNNFYVRENILVRKNSITNIVFVPPTQDRLVANKLAFWTSSSPNGPWTEVLGTENSIWGGSTNFFNINSIESPDPAVTYAFGDVWQLIQIYVPNTVNPSQIYAKFGPKNSNPNCSMGTACRHTNLVVIDSDGLPENYVSGYYQHISGNNILKTTVDYSQDTIASFKGNVNIWSSDPYFTKQIPLQLTGAIDYIKY